MDREQLIDKLNSKWHDLNGCPICGAFTIANKELHKEFHILEMDSLIYIHKRINDLQKQISKIELDLT